MEDNDIIRLSDFEAIAKKINSLPRPFDIQAHDLNLTEKEARLVSALGTVAKVGLFNEFKHLKDKIHNHHHVVLSVNDGIEFRENGNRFKPNRSSETGMGTTRNECNV